MSISVTVSYAPEQFVVMGSMYGYGKRGFLNRYQVKGDVPNWHSNRHSDQCALLPICSQTNEIAGS